jgi:hypothetical protein
MPCNAEFGHIDIPDMAAIIPQCASTEPYCNTVEQGEIDVSHWKRAGRAVLVATASGLVVLISACDMSPEYPVLDGNDGHSSLKYEPPEETSESPNSAAVETQNTSLEEPPLRSEPNAPGADNE